MYRVSTDSQRKRLKYAPLQHIDQHETRVNRTCRSIVLGMTVVFLAGCSISTGKKSLENQDQLVTSSVTKPVESQGIGSQDAEIIKTVVVQSEQDKLLAWQNPESGNKGTITAIDNFIGSHGQQCKKFQTTVDSFMGISLYNGETCELKKGFWVLSWFLRHEG